jgi:3-methyladenine DNA glycosylase/8-oxoguanine DNA glycosylase
MQLSINIPRTFNFKRTVLSHGWCALLPFHCDRKGWVLSRVLDLPATSPVTIEMRQKGSQLRINTSRRLSKSAAESVLRAVRHMLRLDDDMGEFYKIVKDTPGFEWIADAGAGRMLRSPTVFEDLVKMICTTNCSWALTEKMVTGLVQNLGRRSDDGLRGFPTPSAMAAMPLKFFVDEVRAGYRAPYLKELAGSVAAGKIRVESWADSSLPTNELQKEMRSVKGVGPYAAENLLKLVGRYDGLALDSWTRAKFYQVRNNGRKTTDKKIARYYAQFREWQGLAFWCDMTRDWIDADGNSAH